MSESESLLRAVIADPDDDLPRLILADWFEENGEPDRAEFIRVQCERARLPFDDVRQSALMAREWRLLAPNYDRWAAGCAVRRFRRGFGEVFGYDAAGEFAAAADAAFERHPVRGLRVSFRDGLDADQFRSWAEGGHLGRLQGLALHRLDTAGAAEMAAAWVLLEPSDLASLRRLKLAGVWLAQGFVEQRRESFAPVNIARLRIDSPDAPAVVEPVARFALESEWPGLTQLHLSGFADESLFDRVAVSRVGERLTELDLPCPGEVGPEPLAAFAEYLESSRLVRLRLCRHRFAFSPSEQVSGHLAAALGRLSRWGDVEALDLSRHPLGGRPCADLAASPALGRLRRLDLMGCGLQMVDIDALARSPHCPRPGLLDLSRNGIGNAALPLLFDSPMADRLVHLDLSGTMVNGAGLQTLARHPKAAKLRVLIAHPGVGDVGLRAIAESPYLENLVVLHLVGDRERFHDRPTDAGVFAVLDSGNLPRLSVVRFGQRVNEASQRRLIETERIAWPGLHELDLHSERMRGRYRERFGSFPGGAQDWEEPFFED